MGKWGAGLVNIALAESYFEKGQTDYYEIMTLLNSGYTKADMGGKIEMCFVATAVLCRIHIIKNQPQQARNQMMQFAEKAKAEDATRLLPNLRAFVNDLDLLEGNIQNAEQWLTEDAPNEYLDFYVMDRYKYLSKVRTYLTLGRNEEALNLIERMSVYFKGYGRIYDDMENEILKAITQYRLKVGDWQKTFEDVLPHIEKYHFMYLIGREGIAIRDLYKEYLKEHDKLPITEKFAKDMIEHIDKMAVYYPNYLVRRTHLDEDLTDTEKKILHLYCKGAESDLICDLCSFSYNTLKYHSRNLYRKLGVANRSEAERKAKELGIL